MQYKQYRQIAGRKPFTEVLRERTGQTGNGPRGMTKITVLLLIMVLVLMILFLV